jgi:hypothetical protein
MYRRMHITRSLWSPRTLKIVRVTTARKRLFGADRRLPKRPGRTLAGCRDAWCAVTGTCPRNEGTNRAQRGRGAAGKERVPRSILHHHKKSAHPFTKFLLGLPLIWWSWLLHVVETSFIRHRTYTHWDRSLGQRALCVPGSSTSPICFVVLYITGRRRGHASSLAKRSRSRGAAAPSAMA